MAVTNRCLNSVCLSVTTPTPPTTEAFSTIFNTEMDMFLSSSSDATTFQISTSISIPSTTGIRKTDQTATTLTPNSSKPATLLGINPNTAVTKPFLTRATSMVTNFIATTKATKAVTLSKNSQETSSVKTIKNAITTVVTETILETYSIATTTANKPASKNSETIAMNEIESMSASFALTPSELSKFIPSKYDYPV